MNTKRRLYEEIALCLLLKQISKKQLLFFIKSFINGLYNVPLDDQRYINKHVIPLLISNFAFIEHSGLISEESFLQITSSHSVASQTSQLFLSKPPDEMTLETFKYYLQSLLAMKSDIASEHLAHIQKIFKQSAMQKEEAFQLFFDMFYLNLQRNKQASFIKGVNDESFRKLMCDVVEASGFPGVLYAPICVNEKTVNLEVDLIDRVIEVETFLAAEMSKAIRRSYIATTTVYDFYIQLMISYDINMDLYALLHKGNEANEGELKIAIQRKDFSKTLEKLLTEYNIDVNKTIHLTITPLLSKAGNSAIYFINDKLNPEVRKLFDLWWMRVRNAYENDAKNETEMIMKGLRCQIQEATITNIIEKEWANTNVTDPNNVIKLIKETTPCLLHFIIGFTCNSNDSSITPYARNTISTLLPRHLFIQSSIKSDASHVDKNDLKFLPNDFNNSKDDSFIYEHDYHSLFNYWLNLKNCQSAFISSTNVFSLQILLMRVNQAKQTQFNQKLNLYAKTILQEVKQTPLAPDQLKLPELETLMKGDKDRLYFNEHLFRLYYYLYAELRLNDLKQEREFQSFYSNVIKSRYEVAAEVILQLFKCIKKDVPGYFESKWFDYLIKGSKDEHSRSKNDLMWQLIEVINSFSVKQQLTSSYDEFQQIIPSTSICEYIQQKDNIPDVNREKISEYLLFTATYYSKEMKQSESKFNETVQAFFMKGSITEAKMKYALYYYLTQANCMFHPISLIKASNSREMLISSIMIQFYTIKLFYSIIQERPKEEKKVPHQPFLDLFNDMNNMTVKALNFYGLCSKFNFMECSLNNVIFLFIQLALNEVPSLKACFMEKFPAKYDKDFRYDADILVLNHTEVLDAIQEGSYMLKGYWIRVNAKMDLYHCYCKINEEWFLYTSTLRQVKDLSQMMKTSKWEITLIYIKKDKEKQAPAFIQSAEVMLDNDIISKHPYTFIELAFENTSFIDYFFKRSGYMPYLKALMRSLNKESLETNSQFKEERVKKFCRHLITYYKLEADIDEYFRENVIQYIKLLIKTNLK